ncbi:MAG: DUF2798 domain-containing protein [Lachnospiraceae bacterium]|nr:DUF2798 domain-containing protein [Lachnospiraceae bacterium]
MTYFNGLLNGALIQGAMTGELFRKVTMQEPLFWLIAFMIAMLGMQKLSARAAARIFQKTDSPNTKIFLLSFFMVLFMSPCVLLARMLIQCGFGAEAFRNLVKYWPRAFTFALFYQLIFAGPLARRILRLLRKREK